MLDDSLLKLAEAVLAHCRKTGKTIATAESCTGGLISSSLTSVAGASEIFERGFVTYSNEAKSELLNVPDDLIREQGAVSGAVACAMAEGALENSHADTALSCTGIAGPDGGTVEKPVGTVHIAKAQKTPDGIKTEHISCEFGEKERHLIQLLTARVALEMIISEEDGSLA